MDCILLVELSREEVQTLAPGVAAKPGLALQFACGLVVDVVAQGWKLKAGRKQIQIRAPANEGETPEAIKCRIRPGHLLERDAQLRQTSGR